MSDGWRDPEAPDEDVAPAERLRPTDERLIDADVEGLVDEEETEPVPDPERRVPEDAGGFVPGDDAS